MHSNVNVACQGKSGPGKIHEVILVDCHVGDVLVTESDRNQVVYFLLISRL